jgi:aryl-alcohol dehydrogenase-like predicted oxidoreductase
VKSILLEVSMEYRRLGNSDLEVSIISFGAWAIGGWMWGGADRKDALAAIDRAFDLGVTTIDTAPAYGFGLSEEIVGEAVKGKREKVQILTKYGLRWDTDEGEFFFDTEDSQGKPVKMFRCAGKESVIFECESSLKRLGTDYIDLFQIHWSDPATPIEETMLAVEKLIQEGKVRAAGVCNYSVEEMKTAEEVIPLASNQVPYSMVNRGIEEDVVPYCIQAGKGILPYSPLQRGLLTGKFGTDHKFAPGDHRPSTSFFKPENLQKVLDFLDRIRPIAADHNATLAQLVIRWTMNRQGITSVLVGARNPAQVEENAKAVDLTLSEEEIAAIDDHLDNLQLEV